jgi:hypothetical protein
VFADESRQSSEEMMDLYIVQALMLFGCPAFIGTLTSK